MLRHAVTYLTCFGTAGGVGLGSFSSTKYLVCKYSNKSYTKTQILCIMSTSAVEFNTKNHTENTKYVYKVRGTF